MDLRRLTSFLHVAELGSLSKASDRMRVAQPALSRQMRILEEDVGAALFARHRRGMVLTEAGEALYKRISTPLRELSNAVDEVRAVCDVKTRNLSIGMPPTVSAVIADRLARRVASRKPHMSLRIVEGYGGHLVDWLQRGEIDAAILYGPATDFHMKIDELLVEEMVLVTPANGDLDLTRPMAFAEIARLPLVLPSHPHGLRIVVENVANRCKVKLNVKFEADSFLVLKGLVECGEGYTVLPRSAIRREIAEGRLRAVAITPAVRRQLVLGMPLETGQSFTSRAISQLVHDEIAAMMKDNLWSAFPQFDLNALEI